MAIFLSGIRWIINNASTSLTLQATAPLSLVVIEAIIVIACVYPSLTYYPGVLVIVIGLPWVRTPIAVGVRQETLT